MASVLNTFGNGVYNAEYWAANMQETFYKENVALAIANTQLRDYLKDGDTVNKAYGTYPTIATYTKGTDISVPAYSGTNEYLQVATAKVSSMYIDDIDKLQNKWDQAAVFAKRAGKILSNNMDQAILAEYSNASSYISAADVGGSGSGTFVPNTSNITEIFAIAGRKLDNYDVGQSDRFAIIGPRLREILRLSVAGRETGFGDTVGDNGALARRFGFDIYYSNNLPFAATWTPDNLPTDEQYITIAGVTFTFETGTCDTAGDVKAVSDVATTLDNLVDAINGTGTAGSGTYIAVSDRDRWKLNKAGITATDGTTYLGITGYGDIVVTTSDTNDAWTSQAQYPLFGLKGAINFVVQKAPEVEFHQAELKLGKYLFAWQLYGKKTFTEDKDALVYARIDASSWT